MTDSSQLRAARTDPVAFESFYRRSAPALHSWLRTQVPPDAPGTITPYDANGTVLAERPVAAVAYWHSRR